MGITTGEFSNAFLSFTFSRFGLNHLLAISGFHFGLLLLFCNFILSPIFSKKWKTILLIISLAGFYFFVGDTPSLSRAWIVSTLYLIAVLLDKRPSPINTLSLSLSVILILDPLMIYHLGFQFSFWVTYGILFYSNRIEQWIKKRKFRNFYLKNTVIKAVALGLSVHVAAVPLTLYYFHKFYFLSFIFNFFVPLIVGATLFIFLSALLIYFFAPFLAHYLFLMVNHATKWLLDFIYWVPTSFDYSIRVPTFPLSLLFCYLVLFVFFGALKSDPLLSPLEFLALDLAEQKKS
jgi:competence protein ComEC